MTHNNPNSNSQSSRWFQPPPTNQQPLPLPQSFPPFVPGSQANGMPWGAQPIGSMYQGLVQQGPPSSGSYRNHRGGGRPRTGPQQPNQNLHASSGMTRRGHSASTYQGHAWMGAGNNPGTGGSSRLPSRNPSSANWYHRGPSRTRRRTEDLSVYEVPITDLPMGSSAATGGPNTPAVIPAISLSALQPPTPASTTSTSTSTAGVSDEDMETTTSTEIQEGSFEDDDCYTISSGSDIE